MFLLFKTKPFFKSMPKTKVPNINLVTHAGESEETEYEPYEDNEDMKEEEEQTHPDEEVSLVIQLLLCTPKKEEDAQRHSIFKTRTTVNKRVYDLDY